MEDHNNYHNTAGQPEPPQPPAAATQPAQAVPVYVTQSPDPKRKSGLSIVWMLVKYAIVLILVASLAMNLIFGSVIGQGIQEEPFSGTNADEKIALIDLAGPINMKTPQSIRQMLKRAANDDAVGGIILVINSPGGQVVPSEMVHRYVSELTTAKPVYACIEQVGASGAYWVAVAADKIYAQTNSVVGSIGVIYISLVVEEALKEKLGIDPVVLKSRKAEFKDRGSPFRQPTADEINEIKDDLDAVHKRFVDVVSKDRRLTEDQTWKLAKGEIFDGPESLTNGLIDSVGFLEDVISDMTGQLQLADPLVVHYSETPTLRDLLAAGTDSMQNPIDIKAILNEWTGSSGIMALWPGR